MVLLLSKIMIVTIRIIYFTKVSGLGQEPQEICGTLRIGVLESLFFAVILKVLPELGRRFHYDGMVESNVIIGGDLVQTLVTSPAGFRNNKGNRQHFYPLFERIGRRNYLTAAGKTFLPHAAEILRLMQKVSGLGQEPQEICGTFILLITAIDRKDGSFMSKMAYLKDMPIAVLGGGAVGKTCAADNKLAGREVRLYDAMPFAATGGGAASSQSCRQRC